MRKKALNLDELRKVLVAMKVIHEDSKCYVCNDLPGCLRGMIYDREQDEGEDSQLEMD